MTHVLRPGDGGRDRGTVARSPLTLYHLAETTKPSGGGGLPTCLNLIPSPEPGHGAAARGQLWLAQRGGPQREESECPCGITRPCACAHTHRCLLLGRRAVCTCPCPRPLLSASLVFPGQPLHCPGWMLAPGGQRGCPGMWLAWPVITRSSASAAGDGLVSTAHPDHALAATRWQVGRPTLCPGRVPPPRTHSKRMRTHTQP